MKIIISGEGGQGVQLISNIIADACYEKGDKISFMPHYGVEMRMGVSFSFIRIQKNQINYPKFKSADILAAMSKREIEITKRFIDKNTRVINVIDAGKYLEKENISGKSLNMLTLGIILKELNITEYRLDINKIKDNVRKKMQNAMNLDENLKAIDLGMAMDPKLYNVSILKFSNDNLDPVSDSDNNKEHVKFPSLCKSCGLCMVKCPVNALSWSKDKINYIKKPLPSCDVSKCITCMKCENICPDSAIKIIKKK